MLTLADAIFPSVTADNRSLVIARNLALMVGFALLVALFAQIQVRLPWTTVPITGQTYAALVAGGALGAWRGAGAMVIYILMALVGLPVFTPANSVTSGEWDLHFILPWSGNDGYLWNITSGGYIVGFALAAGLVGYLAQRRWDRGPWVHVGMLAGTLLVYVPGLLWLGYLISTDWVAPGGETPISELISGSSDLDKTLTGGLYPFVVGDLMKVMLAAATLPGAWLLIEKLKGKPPAGDESTSGRGGASHPAR
jgi:biotin transport system substrate-specific component